MVFVCLFVYLSLMNERTNERITFLDDGGESGSYSLFVFLYFFLSFFLSFCLSVHSSVNPFVHLSFPPVIACSLWGQEKGEGDERERTGRREDGQGRTGQGGARRVHYAPGSH